MDVRRKHPTRSVCVNTTRVRGGLRTLEQGLKDHGQGRNTNEANWLNNVCKRCYRRDTQEFIVIGHANVRVSPWSHQSPLPDTRLQM